MFDIWSAKNGGSYINIIIVFSTQGFQILKLLIGFKAICDKSVNTLKPVIDQVIAEYDLKSKYYVLNIYFVFCT